MKILLCILAFTAITMLSGCSLSPLPSAPTSTYTLTNWAHPSARHAQTDQARSSKTILVSMPTASPGYQTAAMVYETIPYQLRSFADHRWIAPPAHLLLPLMATRLRQLHYFRAVVTPPFSGTVDYQLNTQLLTLQQEFLQPRSVIRLTLQATLINTTTGRVMGTRVFEVVVPASDNNPYSGVLAANKAAHQVCRELAQHIMQWLQ